MVSRRMILAVPALGALAACAPSPVVSAGSSAASHTLAPDDPRRVGAGVEASLGAFVEARRADAAADEDAGLAAWYEAAAAAHSSHVRVLLQADPLGGTRADPSPIAEPSTPAPTPEPSGALAQAYRDAEASHRAAASGEQDSSMRMLWCSLAVFAGRAAVALGGPDPFPAPVAGRAVPVHVEPGTALDSADALVSRLDALRYGLETMIGRSGGTRADMSARRDEVEALRVEAAERIAAAGGRTAGPELEYELGGDPDDEDSRDGIWAGLEDAVLAGWLRLAAATPGAGESAGPSGTGSPGAGLPYGLDEILDRAVAQAGQAPARGLGTCWWPGWV